MFGPNNTMCTSTALFQSALSPRRTMDFDLTHGSAILARTPAALHALLDGLDTSWTSATDGPDTWSAYDRECLPILDR